MPVIKKLDFESGQIKIVGTNKDNQPSLNISFNPVSMPFDGYHERKIQEVIEKRRVEMKPNSFDIILSDWVGLEDITNCRPFSEAGFDLTYNFARHMEEVTSKHFESFSYLSPFRSHPLRTYYESTKTEISIDRHGEGYLDLLMFWESKSGENLNQVVENMSSMGLLTSLQPKRFGGGRYDLEVMVPNSTIYASLSDVGFGISQFLPIMVLDTNLPWNSTLFLAEPEIHLHPSVQANFGDYLTKRINETHKSYVVETHSEYLLNRIRLNIVKGILKQEDLQVYFLESKEDDTAVHKIQFTKDGRILGAPENFFKTYFIDVMDIAMNAFEE